ncbi:MAG: hypothetical protein AVDCRST_MAG19-550 [uncultured Thermomicrobiales bacterium]|uniref:Alpha/beta hydrolase fold-3 domain-containing protein n=1 Tax=uncultured Thermomicrobiales bacterium TaxID=1645740 RepID=A0A6J4UHJ0_9BACT|nr:MAG: hypothetical protein AVDCRST_MAG19-550 [uncultured Thermomicrobiales bacterium]
MSTVDPKLRRTPRVGADAQSTRRGFVGGAAKLAGGGALALSGAAVGGLRPASAQDATPAPAGATPPPAIAEATPTEAEGANEQMRRVLDAFAAFEAPPVNSQTPFNARNLPSFANAAQTVLAGRGQPALDVTVGVSHVLIPGPVGEILARVYTPAGSGPFPVVVYFHGGGFVIANLDTYDASARALASEAGAVVVAIAYRQAPESPFPAAVDDAYAATQYLIENAAEVDGDPARVAVAGESAGGNLATVVCLRAREEGGRMPVHQLLVYPVTTFAPEGEAAESIEQGVGSAFLSPAALEWFGNYYLPDGTAATDPYASPLAADDLGGLPPATIIAAEIDPLLSQGRVYGEALEEAGVDVEYRLYEGVAHEFFGMVGVVDLAQEAVAFAAERLMGSFEAADGGTPTA